MNFKSFQIHLAQSKCRHLFLLPALAACAAHFAGCVGVNPVDGFLPAIIINPDPSTPNPAPSTGNPAFSFDPTSFDFGNLAESPSKKCGPAQIYAT